MICRIFGCPEGHLENARRDPPGTALDQPKGVASCLIS
jgi:hypothetical protein